LSGTGVVAVPALAWSPATSTVSFTNTAVGSSSSTQSLTLLNQGPGPVTLQQIALAGAQAAEFSVSGGTCTASTTLNQAGSCTVVLGFQPGAAGLRQATLQIASNGTNPPDVALSGTGSAAAAPLVSVSPSAISISGSPQLLTLMSTGSAPLQVQQIFVSNGSFTVDPAPSGGCPTVPFTLMPAQSCSVLITWTNSSAATESGMVEVVTDAATAPVMIDVQAQQAAAPVPMMQNVGSGGCSIARGDAPTDPFLWLLAALAAGVLWRRRRS
jgi:MYXO-CTERM domain-containing protein